MKEEFKRTSLLIGEEAVNKLNSSSVIVFGIGGVGGFVCEGLARAGVSKFLLVDNDVVSTSNINRQIIALHSTIGKYKTEVMKDRILDINPDAIVEVRNMFFLPENEDTFDFSSYDYVIDCVDTISAKLAIICKAKKENVMVISSMGTGNKLNANQFIVSDINQTSVCPLAKVMRYELKKRDICHVKVVYSKEEPIKVSASDELPTGSRRSVPGSISFVPSSAGLLIASEVIKDLIKE